MATNIILPEIPTLDIFKYKHYYITRDKNNENRVYLYLLEYEPASLEVDEKGYIVALQKYGNQISYRKYTYTIGQTSWGYNGVYNTPSNLYSDFGGTLIYNNFIMHFEGGTYEKNPLSDDLVVPALEPEFPRIPNEGNFQYKHYYIVQNKESIEKYHLYLFAYEPVSAEVNDKGYLVLSQKYGNQIICRQYTYKIGQASWSYTGSYNTPTHLYSDFAQTLVHNNFIMDFEEVQYETNGLPNDQVVLALQPSFPGIPNMGNFQYKHYYIVQNKESIEKYHLYLFDYEPVSVEVNDKGYLVLSQKYGNQVICRQYTYKVGEENWIYTGSYNKPTHLYSDFVQTLIHNNFTMDFGEVQYETNELLNDQVVLALQPSFPGIPNMGNFQYKHYYIVQNKESIEKYHLYLFNYEPVSVEVNDKGYLVLSQKYGNQVICRQYTYKIGEESWIYTGSYNKPTHLYSDFAQTLVHNNFTMDFEEVQYEANKLLNDQIILALQPNFPAIPNMGNFQYKHYYIVQNKESIEKYHLYLFAYEPVSAEVNDKGYLVLSQKYGNQIICRQYTYKIGEESWNYTGSYNKPTYLYSDFVETVIHSNFSIDFFGDYCKKYEFLNGGIVLALAPEFPPIPKISAEEDGFCYYILSEDTAVLENYTLYLLKGKPADCRVTEKGLVEFVDEEGNTIPIRQYNYKIGATAWTYSGSYRGIYSVYISHFIDFCNFDVKAVSMLSESVEPVIESPCNPYPGDGIGFGVVRNNWVRVNGKWYYYKNGTKQVGWIRSNHLRTNLTYYADLSQNGARVEDRFKYVEGYFYRFNGNGVMETSNFKDNEDEYFIVEANGVIVNQIPNFEYYRVNAPMLKVYTNMALYSNYPKELATISENTIIKAVVKNELMSVTKNNITIIYIRIYYDGVKTGWVPRSRIIGQKLANEGSGPIADKYYAGERLKIRATPYGQQIDGTRVFKPGAIVKIHESKETERVDGSDSTWVKVYYDVNKIGWVGMEVLKELPQPATGYNFQYNWRKSQYVTQDFEDKATGVAKALNINPDDLMAVMAFESRFNPAQKNEGGSSATGLIQCTELVAGEIHTTTAELAKMSGVEQLDYVFGYLYPEKGNLNDLSDLYMSILCPEAVGKSDNYVLYSKGTDEYTYNQPLDSNNDGKITKKEATQAVIDRRSEYT